MIKNKIPLFILGSKLLTAHFQLNGDEEYTPLESYSVENVVGLSTYAPYDYTENYTSYQDLERQSTDPHSHAIDHFEHYTVETYTPQNSLKSDPIHTNYFYEHSYEEPAFETTSNASSDNSLNCTTPYEVISSYNSPSCLNVEELQYYTPPSEQVSKIHETPLHNSHESRFSPREAPENNHFTQPGKISDTPTYPVPVQETKEEKPTQIRSGKISNTPEPIKNFEQEEIPSSLKPVPTPKYGSLTNSSSLPKSPAAYTVNETPEITDSEEPKPRHFSFSEQTPEPKPEPKVLSLETNHVALPAKAPAPLIAQTEEIAPKVPDEISINFNNVSMIEIIRYVSAVTHRNFIYNEADLQFNVSIISKEPTSTENIIAAIMQELRIRNLMLLEQGNNIIIHRNPNVKAPSQIASTERAQRQTDSAIITRVFRLNTLDPMKAAEIIRPLLSQEAQVNVLKDSNNLIITDLTAVMNKISDLISSLDAPSGGMTIGQYVVKNTVGEAILQIAEKILHPIAQGNPFVLVPHAASNSIYIVSNPFIVEKALVIMHQLDVNDGNSKILTMEGLKLEEVLGVRTPGYPGYPGGPSEGFGIPGTPGYIPPGFIPGAEPGIAPGIPPGERGFAPLTPSSVLPSTFPTVYPGERVGPGFQPGRISAASAWSRDIPAGRLERTLFFIHKLKYRKGDQIELALRKIADTLMISKSSNADLIDAINSTQWLESSNSLIFAGTTPVLEKIRELIDEIDVPLRQVFIEMLILDTTIADSLRYSVDWGTRFGGGNTEGAQGIFGSGPNSNTPNQLPGTLNVASIPNNGQALGSLNNTFASPLASAAPGPFQWGIIGRHLTFCGMHFSTIGALVNAIHNDTKAQIVLNPKIITEDNNTAEIFVGDTNLYKTQSIANDQGNVVTNNFQLIDLGTTLRVTPMIGNNGLITMDIVEEITQAAPGATSSSATNQQVAAIVLTPLFVKSRTTTRVHVPNGFFVILSGQIRDTRDTTQSRIPCLGGVPLLGSLGKSKICLDAKRNLMIFIRPLIVDTEEDLELLTRRQQDIYREKNKFERRWNYEVDEALDFLNIKPTDPDEISCILK